MTTKMTSMTLKEFTLWFLLDGALKMSNQQRNKFWMYQERNIFDYPTCHTNIEFYMSMTLILHFMVSISFLSISYVKKWIPRPKKWYISCITQGYWMKTVQTRIFSFRGRLWPLTTPKMTSMTLKKMYPMIFC